MSLLKIIKPSILSLISIVCIIASTPALSAGPQISDGKPIEISDLGIAITPPAGWEVLPETFGLSLVLQEPAAETLEDYSKPVFQRNITVAVSHESTPIDKNEAARLREQLQETFGEQPRLQDYVVAEDSRFFDYKGEKDGLVVYSFFEVDGIPMTQMHMLVSGEKNKVLLTYTDLTENFESNLDQAWAAMASVKVVGPAPKRYERILPLALGVAGVIGFMSLFIVIRRLRFRRLLKLAEFDEDEDEDESESESTAANGRRSRSSRKKRQAKDELPLSEPALSLNDGGSAAGGEDDWTWVSSHVGALSGH
jgi:hypothetical protein